MSARFTRLHGNSALLGVPLQRALLFAAGGLLASQFVIAGAMASDAPRLSLPIDCDLGQTCFVQNYVDIDAGAGVRDYACGGATYDGHKGTDIRVLSTAASDAVAVVAAADGTVLRGRDSMPDRLLRDYASKDELQSIVGANQCGNGLIVDHGGGWTTQYCHLKRGSIVAKPGQAVKAGDRLGTVGYSGTADFAHVHMTVRHHDQVIDPFSGQPVGQANGAACNAAGLGAQGLWQADLRDRLAYGRDTIIGAGFAAAPPGNDDLERDDRVAEPGPDSPALLFYARLMNVRAGDRIKLLVTGPGSFRVANDAQPLDRNKAIQLLYVGKRLKASRWPAGTYTGVVAVMRRGAAGEAARVVAQETRTFEIR